MVRKRLVARFGRKYVTLGLVVISLVLVGIIVFQETGSRNGEGIKDAPTAQESTDTETAAEEFTEQRLVRIDAEEASWLGGVLAGFAFYFGLPLWLLRLLFVAVVIL